MKRAIIFILTLVISLSFCVPAFAEVNINEIDGTNEFVEEIKNDEELIDSIVDYANNEISKSEDFNISFSKSDVDFENAYVFYGDVKTDGLCFFKFGTSEKTLLKRIDNSQIGCAIPVTSQERSICVLLKKNSKNEWEICSCVNRSATYQPKEALKEYLERENATPNEIRFICCGLYYPVIAVCFFENGEPLLIDLNPVTKENYFTNSTVEGEIISGTLVRAYTYKEFKTQLRKDNKRNVIVKSAYVIIAIVFVSFVILFIVKRKKQKKA